MRNLLLSHFLLMDVKLVTDVEGLVVDISVIKCAQSTILQTGKTFNQLTANILQNIEDTARKQHAQHIDIVADIH